MKDFSKAAPRPWSSSGEQSSNGSFRIEDADGWHVSWVKDSKDVPLMINAVNNFDDFVKCLRMLNKGLNDGLTVEKNDQFHDMIKSILKQIES